MLAAADGNVSTRLDEERILITPSGVEKAFVKPEQMAMISLEGEVLEGMPSAEVSMHLEVYRQCPEARSVVHAHPPHAIAWSLACPDMTELPSNVLPEVLLATGRVPVVPYARPTTNEMAEKIRPYLDHKVMILARHGA
jgi:Ribulose-5-phosphate 4-epimerase and related epimerases and aldolases